MKKLFKSITTFYLCLFLMVVVIVIAISGGSMQDSSHNNVAVKLNAAVERYREYVQGIAKSEGIEEYTELILCVMQVESGGDGQDPMQSSEGPYNKLFPQKPNGIIDPQYSINCGIKELKDCLHRARVNDPTDYENIKVALGGYNLGNGFIEWTQKNHEGKWSLEVAQEFSDIWKSKLGWPSYGDPPYANKVMKYYQNGVGTDSEVAKTAAMGTKNYNKLMSEAKKYIGYPYVFGGSSPSTSFDCSGFICWSYTHAGVYNLPRTTAQGIFNQCARIDPDEVKPGDLVFYTGTYDCDDAISHIGIYIGDHQMLHCGNPIGYAYISSEYWQQHFYAYGRLPIKEK